MSIPLVQNNDKDAINTSIIAIKRNIERINMLLGLVDSGSPDLSGLATKQELEDAITQVETDLAPVDEVTSGNMQSVTSNAVAVATDIKTIYVPENGPVVKVKKCGFFIYGSEEVKQYFVKAVGAGETVLPVNSYWGDPAGGYSKYMWGIYI